MMKLNHIHLAVGDVAASRDFLTTHFGMKTVMELPGNTMAILRDDGEMVLILSHFDKKVSRGHLSPRLSRWLLRRIA